MHFCDVGFLHQFREENSLSFLKNSFVTQEDTHKNFSAVTEFVDRQEEGKKASRKRWRHGGLIDFFPPLIYLYLSRFFPPLSNCISDWDITKTRKLTTCQGKRVAYQCVTIDGRNTNKSVRRLSFCSRPSSSASFSSATSSSSSSRAKAMSSKSSEPSFYPKKEDYKCMICPQVVFTSWNDFENHHSKVSLKSVDLVDLFLISFSSTQSNLHLWTVQESDCSST